MVEPTACLALLKFLPFMISMVVYPLGGGKQVYDSMGLVVLYIKGAFSLYGANTRTTQLCEMVWQPRMTTENSSFLSRVKELVDVGAVAEMVADVAIAKQSTSGVPCVFRVLEIIEANGSSEGGKLVIEALSRLRMGPNILVECFLCSHSRTLLNVSASGVSRDATWLRVRKVFFPSMRYELPDICFDAIIINDWTLYLEHVSAASESIMASALATLSSFCTPGSQLVIRDIDANTAEACLDSSKSYGQAIFSPETSTICIRVCNPYMQNFDSLKPVTLVIADRSSLSSQLIIQLRRESEVKGLDSSQVQVLSCSHRDMADDASSKTWSNTIRAFTIHVKAQGQVLSSVVFAAGFEDNTVLGEQAFERLAKLSQALQIIRDDLMEVKPDEQEISLWILSNNCFSKNICVNQGSIQGLSLVICHELSEVETRIVDIEGEGDMSLVVDLILSPPREKMYLVTRKGVLVPRHFPVDIKQARSIRTSPDSDISYYCDVSTGMSTPGQVDYLRYVHYSSCCPPQYPFRIVIGLRGFSCA